MALPAEEERAVLRQRERELAEAEEARRRRVTVSIDLLGRKVVMVRGWPARRHGRRQAAGNPPPHMPPRLCLRLPLPLRLTHLGRHVSRYRFDMPLCRAASLVPAQQGQPGPGSPPPLCATMCHPAC